MSSGQFRSGAIDADGAVSDPESFVGRYCLRIGPRQIQLLKGETFIGRDEACQVVISGALVSRRHACIRLEEGELSLEDLRSTNGTFVNGAKVRGRVPIRPGDRLFVGSFDIDVAWLEGAAPSSGVTGKDAFHRATPSSGIALAGKLAAAREKDHAEALTERHPPRSVLDLDDIEAAARLAEQMFAQGRPLAGRDILSEPLKRVLAAAREGRLLDPQVLDAAGRYAMKVAQQVCDANWVNFTIEIHLRAGHAMRMEILQQIVALRKIAPVGDDELIARYRTRMHAMIKFMPLSERLQYADLFEHVSSSDDDE